MGILFIIEFTTNVLRHIGLGRRRCLVERDLSNTITIVTGANSGIGKQTVYELALRGSLVIMACRSVVAGERAKLEFMERNRKLKLVVMKLDLGSLESVNEFADCFISQFKQLDLLINNAGVMACPTLTLSQDGHELQFAVNHLGKHHFWAAAAAAAANACLNIKVLLYSRSFCVNSALITIDECQCLSKNRQHFITAPHTGAFSAGRYELRRAFLRSDRCLLCI